MPFYGDLHNHCGISYGHGALDDAYRNARLQLDFASVTPHAYWPDIPEGVAGLEDVVAYHRAGFAKAASHWHDYRATTDALNDPGRFVTLPSWEWHSLRHGDHCIYYRGPGGEIIPAADLEELRTVLRTVEGSGTRAFLIPHHIGYRQGRRGINWADWTPEFSPVAEIISMHGAAESDDAPYPYLHTMGPRDGGSTYHAGLQRGYIVGAIGSTDHHSAHPGSHGYGRLAVWATDLSRDGIWAAIAARRTYALTGDRIALRFSLNEAPMGTVLGYTPEREIEVEVEGGDTIDSVEVLCNGAVIHRWTPPLLRLPHSDGPLKVALELGWGEAERDTDWTCDLRIEHGALLDVEPRFRGDVVVAPQERERQRYAFSSWDRPEPNRVRCATRTFGNPTVRTPATQGVCMKLVGDAHTTIAGTINGDPVMVTLGDLANGSVAGYLGSFLAPAYHFHRPVHSDAFCCAFASAHRSEGTGRDWYTVRVRQRNEQWAWSSPIWVEAAPGSQTEAPMKSA